MKRCLSCNKFLSKTVTGEHCDNCNRDTFQRLTTVFHDQGRYDLNADLYVQHYRQYITEQGIPDNDISMKHFLNHYVSKRKRAPGAGRPKIGEPKRLTLNLPDEEWDIIDELIKGDENYKSYAEYFRHLHMCARMNMLPSDYKDVNS